MDMIGKVRRMRMRDKLSISEIAKTTRLSRNTIKKWLNEPGDAAPRYRRTSAEGKRTTRSGYSALRVSALPFGLPERAAAEQFDPAWRRVFYSRLFALMVLATSNPRAAGQHRRSMFTLLGD